MATPPNQATAKTTTAADKAALQATALANFTSESAIIINNNIALGLYHAFLTLPNDKNLKMRDLRTYYTGLGYTFCPLNRSQNPHEFFEEFLFFPDFWQPRHIVEDQIPRRFKLTWKQP